MVPVNAIVRTDLMAPFTEFDLAFNRSKFIAPKVFPTFPTNLQAADVGKLRIEDLLQNRDTSQAPGGGARRGSGNLDKYSYVCTPYLWEEAVNDWQSKVFRDLIDAEVAASLRVVDAIAGHYERDAAAAAFDTVAWTGAALTTALAGTGWADHANSKPIDDVFSAKEKVFSGTGLVANALICNYFAYWHMCQSAQVLDRVKWTKEATQEQMARDIAACLGIDMVLVAGGAMNTANPQQNAAISRVWSNTMAMVAKVAVSNDPMEPCLGRTFMWTEDAPGALGTDEEIAVLMDEYREEKVLGSVIRGRNNRDIRVMYKEAGHLLTNVTA